MDGKSLHITEEKLNKLKEIIPVAFTENKIDWEKLKAALGEDIEFKNERYVLNWAGKSDAFRVLQSPTTATLIPAKDESVNFDNTENIFIEGENLEVLKVLQKSYFGKIKMIYIDPPYNTGNDNFIYPDKFSETREEYLGRIGDKDETGYMTREGLFRKNSKDSGHYHSNWLSMVYPRLFLARNLLREDGVIFVSIDDNEVHNLRMIMNEVFGEENFVDCIIWKKRYGGGAKEKYLVSLHEYVLIYAKNLVDLPEIYIPLAQKSIERYYKLKDQNIVTKGPYRTHPLEATKSMGERKNLVYPIPAPDETEIIPKRQWLWGKERTLKALKNCELEFLKDKDGKWSVHTKQYLKDENGEIRKDKAFSIIDDVYTQHGTNEIIDLFGNAQIFSFPKATTFINFLINIGIQDSTGIILDFFPGSCSTAHAVLALNKRDNGNRKFIMVQLPEKCDEKSEAFKAGYKTIAEIGKERIRKVIKKIKEEQDGKIDFGGGKQDLGFKVFKLRESNFKIWRSKIETEAKLVEQLQQHLEPLDEHAKTEDVLYELLLKSGIPLTAKVEDNGGYCLANDGEIMKVQIRKTIDEHFLKERKLETKGIKVLSLFFVDRVANYRNYDSDGNPFKGKFSKWFEEIYKEISSKSVYKGLIPFDAEEVHNGYFSADKKGKWKDTKGNTQADDDTFKLIMKNKEKLLSTNEPLRFIFSYSALREGWDNPNVFQICTLNETQSELKKRQEIGRGLRLSVNQEGIRIQDTNINRLTVVANESYEDFAKQLQSEIEEDCGVSFKGRIKNKQKRATVKYRKGFELDDKFRDIWDKIKQQTTYRVEYDIAELIKKAAKAVNQMPATRKAVIKTTKTALEFDETGIVMETRASYTTSLDGMFLIPDILFYIQEKTELTRSTIHNILKKSERIGEVLINPQLFLDNAVIAIKDVLTELMIEGIKYEKIGSKKYEMRLFEDYEIHVNELTFKINKKNKTIYSNLVPLDSNVEYDFARKCESRVDIEFYFKLPFWFKIKTPIGNYNPDWALIKKNEKTVYFVAETKSAGQELKTSEKRKIKCGYAHFNEFEDVKYKQVATVGELD